MDRGCRMMMIVMMMMMVMLFGWIYSFIFHSTACMHSYIHSIAFNRMHDRESERLLHHDLYDKVRHASEVHRQVRHYAQSFIRPGIKLTDMCERLEECNRRLVKENGLQVASTMDTIA